MQQSRNYVLTIAGFDPSSGAGLTADIKTFEQHRVYGLSVCTAITLQTEDTFFETRWEKIEDIIGSITLLLKKYPVSVVKTGILPSLNYLDKIVSFLHGNYPNIKIIVDPILKSSSGFDFLKEPNKNLFYSIINKCYLITPNINEAILIGGGKNAMESAKEISNYCNVLLKGGHHPQQLGVDYLFTSNSIIELKPKETKGSVKHGSGCILSAALAANISLGISLTEACKLSKLYIETVLSSNSGLLAYHHVS